MGQTVTVCAIWIGCHMSAEQMAAVQAVTGISVSQRMSVCGGGDDSLLHFSDVSDWSSSEMPMGQTVTVSEGSICTQMGAGEAVAMCQTVWSDCAIVSGNWCHMFGQSGVG